MIEQLLKEFTNDEIRQAVFDLDPLSSPGPDGFSAGFYQDNWEVVGNGTCATVREISHRRGFQDIKDTFIFFNS